MEEIDPNNDPAVQYCEW